MLSSKLNFQLSMKKYPRNSPKMDTYCDLIYHLLAGFISNQLRSLFYFHLFVFLSSRLDPYHNVEQEHYTTIKGHVQIFAGATKYRNKHTAPRDAIYSDTWHEFYRTQGDCTKSDPLCCSDFWSTLSQSEKFSF